MLRSDSLPPVRMWVAVLAVGLLTGLQPITTDLYLPALPDMQRSLSLTSSEVQWTLSLVILAFGIGQLIWGFISDRYGRQMVLRYGLTIYAVASAVAILAPSLFLILLARLTQGIGLAAVVVCGRSMIRDLYAPEEGAQVMSKGMGLLAMLALFGPVIGGVATTWFGWRACMVLMLVIALGILAFVWLKLPETLPLDRRQLDGSFAAEAAKWRHIAKHPTFRAHTMLTTGTYGGLFVYLSLSSFAFISVLHLSKTSYGAILAMTSLAYFFGTIFCRRALRRFGLIRTVKIGGWLSLASGAYLSLLALGQWLDLWSIHFASILPGLVLYGSAHGLHQPCGQTGVVAAFPHSAGSATALSGFILALIAFGIGAALSWWTSLPGWAGTLYPMLLGMSMGAAFTGWTALHRVQRDGLPHMVKA